LVDEISAYSGERGDYRIPWNGIKRTLKRTYIHSYKKKYREDGFDKEELKPVLKRARSRIGDAVDAVKYMEEAGVPEPEITRRLITAGSTGTELARGEYHSPLSDVIAWGDYTRKEVAAGKYKPAKK
jgi:hypothetical protein